MSAHRLAAFVICIAAAVTVTTPTAAHDRSVSYSFWVLTDGGASVRVRISERDTTRFPQFLEAAYLVPRLRVLAGRAACVPEPGSYHALAAEPGWIERTWRVACPDGRSPNRIESELFLDVIASHVHFARIRDSGGVTVAEQVLTTSVRSAPLARTSARRGAPSTDVAGFLRLGIEHIVTGYDHLVFLFVLVLAAASWRETAAVITGFTVGHSLTLGLTALGVLAPNARAVESLIGLSIALVATENVWLAGRRRGVVIPVAAILSTLAVAAIAASRGVGTPAALVGIALFAACYFALLAGAVRPTRLRWCVAGLFGLVHGFGFAAVLNEVSLPPGRAVLALLGFNVGVEIGQLTCIALAWPMLRLSWRHGGMEQSRGVLLSLGSAAAAAVGVFWFVQRTFG